MNHEDQAGVSVGPDSPTAKTASKCVADLRRHALEEGLSDRSAEWSQSHEAFTRKEHATNRAFMLTESLACPDVSLAATTESLASIYGAGAWDLAGDLDSALVCALTDLRHYAGLWDCDWAEVLRDQDLKPIPASRWSTLGDLDIADLDEVEFATFGKWNEIVVTFDLHTSVCRLREWALVLGLPFDECCDLAEHYYMIEQASPGFGRVDFLV